MVVNAMFDETPLSKVSKLKMKGEKGFEGTLVMKVTVNGNDRFYSLERKLHLEWLLHIVWAKIFELTQKNPIIEE